MNNGKLNHQWCRLMLGTTLLFSFLFLGVLLGWLADHRHQRRRYVALENASETYSVVWQEEMEALGDAASFLVTPTSVFISRSDNDVAREVACMESLRSVTFLNANPTDEHIQLMAPLSGLVRLRVTRGNITDSGLQVIAESFPKLEELALMSCPKLTGEGVDSSLDLQHLRELDLLGCGITSEGIRKLKLPTTLRKLDLSLTAVDDRALGEIAALTNLQELCLWDTDVTDNGLVQLETLENLERLLLTKSKISDAAVGQLQEKLPDCLITGEYGARVQEGKWVVPPKN